MGDNETKSLGRAGGGLESYVRYWNRLVDNSQYKQKRKKPNRLFLISLLHNCLLVPPAWFLVNPRHQAPVMVSRGERRLAGKGLGVDGLMGYSSRRSSTPWREGERSGWPRTPMAAASPTPPSRPGPPPSAPSPAPARASTASRGAASASPWPK